LIDEAIDRIEWGLNVKNGVHTSKTKSRLDAIIGRLKDDASISGNPRDSTREGKIRASQF